MIAYAVNYLSCTPPTLERLVTLIPAARLDERPDADRFTAREALAHLVDTEQFTFARMQTAYETPGSGVVAFDPDELATKHRYGDQPIEETLARFRKARAETLGWLLVLKSEDYRKHVNHPEFGALTIDDMVGMLLGHDLYHLEHLSRFVGERTAGTW